MEQNEINKRLAIIKYLYMMGCDTLLTGSSISKATCVLNFHDAIESFFVLVSEITGVRKTNLNFMDYFEEIKKADEGKGNRELTHKIQMEKLNKLRVNFKHLGISPNEEECNNLKVSLDDFLHENISKFCGVGFDKISLANSIQDEEIKKLVQESEELLKNKDYKGTLSRLGRAFYSLFHKSQNKTKTVFGKSAIFIPPKADLFHTGLPFQAQHEVERIINPFYEPLAEAINIIILGIDYKKYAKFRCLTPRFVTMANGNIVEHGGRDEFNTRFNINNRNAEFCYFFVIESALKIEKFDFRLVSAWEKPDKVTVVDEDEAVLYKQINKQEFKSITTIKKGTIVKLGPVSVNTPEGEFRQVDTKTEQAWIRASTKLKEIDNPELEEQA